jgi:hypothetical protein
LEEDVSLTDDFSGCCELRGGLGGFTSAVVEHDALPQSPWRIYAFPAGFEPRLSWPPG